MHVVFINVLWVACGVGIVAALWALVSSGASWKQYSERGLVMERDHVQPERSTVAADEIRQLVEGANARRARRGEPQLDVDAEVARLLAQRDDAPKPDPQLEAEVRALVELRNRRRIRKGQSPLDVEAEIRRELADLAMFGQR